MNNSMNYTTLESVPINMSIDRHICSEAPRLNPNIKEMTCELHDLVVSINKAAKSIHADLFGRNVDECNKQEIPKIDCYTDALRQITDITAETRAVLEEIRQGFGVGT